WLAEKCRNAVEKYRQNGAGCDDPAATFNAFIEADQHRKIEAILAAYAPEGEAYDMDVKLSAAEEAKLEALRPKMEGKTGWEIIQMVLAMPRRLRWFRSRTEAMNRLAPHML